MDSVFAIPAEAQQFGDVNLVSAEGLNVALTIYGNVVIYLKLWCTVLTDRL